MKIILNLIFFVLVTIGQSQTSDDFTLVQNKKNVYENQGEYHSAYFYIYENKSFVYARIYECGYELTVGTWELQTGIINFTWDSLKTYEATKNKNFYQQYFKYSSPRPFKIVAKKYFYSPQKLILKK